MKGNFLPSFWRSFNQLSSQEQERVRGAILQFLHLMAEQKIPHGLGMKKLHKSIWEIRAGLALRIFFEIRGGAIHFFFVGDHDHVIRFLKNC